jgi:hypothetical protein
MTIFKDLVAKHRDKTFEYKGKVYYEETLVLEMLKAQQDKGKDTVTDKEKAFIDTIAPFVDIYGKQMCRDFYAYWSEKTSTGKKMRFELEKTWDVARRLLRWSSNNSFKKAEAPAPTQRKYKQL